MNAIVHTCGDQLCHACFAYGVIGVFCVLLIIEFCSIHIEFAKDIKLFLKGQLSKKELVILGVFYLFIIVFTIFLFTHFYEIIGSVVFV